MAQVGDVIQNPLTGERLTFLKTSRDTDGELLLIDWFLNPGGFLPGGAHTHPYQEEYFEIVSGTLGVRVGRRKCVLRAGEAATVPPGTLHGWWNEGSDEVHALIGFLSARSRYGVSSRNALRADEGRQDHQERSSAPASGAGRTRGLQERNRRPSGPN